MRKFVPSEALVPHEPQCTSPPSHYDRLEAAIMFLAHAAYRAPVGLYHKKGRVVWYSRVGCILPAYYCVLLYSTVECEAISHLSSADAMFR